MRHSDTVTAIAKAANSKGYHFGALIFNGRSITSAGWCQCKTHPKQAHYMKHAKSYKRSNNYLHAEVHALVTAGQDVSGHDMIVARWANGKLRASHPCGACWEAIKLANIRRCWFWDEDMANWTCKNINKISNRSAA